MKKRIAYCAVILGTTALMSGCAASSRAPVFGPLFTKTSGTEMITSNATSASAKVGTATCEAIIGVATGDCGLEAAMKNGGIKKVHYVDSKVKNVLGIYVEYTLIVHGE
jgi:hypothetical protein